jgi:hypothetical protein
MRRLLRSIFNALTVLSLILSMGIVVVWVRSYYVADYVTQIRAKTPDVTDSSAIRVGRGGVLIAFGQSEDAKRGISRTETPQRWHWLQLPNPRYPDVRSERSFGHFGLRWGKLTDVMIYLAGWWAVVPLWMPATLLILVPAIRITAWVQRRWRIRKRRLLGHCLVCGYDLRETPEMCPECGTAPVKEAT